MISGVFTLTKKLSKEQQELFDEFKVQFLNDNGIDWYEYQRKFKSDTWKIVVNESGKIDSFSKDCSSVFPLNLRVIEVNDLPANVRVNEPWFVNLETLTVFRDEKLLAAVIKQKLIDEASLLMLPLLQAEDDGDLTGDEADKIKSLRQYRIDLRRLDISKAPDIDWPCKPAIIDQ